MNELVQLTNENDIAVITINNPPVNALSPGVPEGISEALDQIAQDDERQSRRPDRRRAARSSPARTLRNSAK